jgi:hypothetical protein
MLNIREEIQRALPRLGLASTGVFLIDKPPINGAPSSHYNLRDSFKLLIQPFVPTCRPSYLTIAILVHTSQEHLMLS